MDISCNTPERGQDYAPDNEITIVVDPVNPNHLVAGSNDYFVQFHRDGTPQLLIPTGFFTSFDGGHGWTEGPIPVRSGAFAGDPSPAFVRRHRVVLMAQLETVFGIGPTDIAHGDVTVSRSSDGGLTWSAPIPVLRGQASGLPGTHSVFYDKEWLTVDNAPTSPFFGRAYLTATRFVFGPDGSFAASPIDLSYSDDGGLTWTEPREISGLHPSCLSQATGPAGVCDGDQYSIGTVASDGTLYIQFLNGQNQAAWEVPLDFDSQIMVVSSRDGGRSFTNPVPVVQLKDGLSDVPFSVLGRQTVWGHRLRWNPGGTIAVNPINPLEVTIVFADRGTPNPNATPGCFFALPGLPPTYAPCNAEPGSDTDVYLVRSLDGGLSWSPRLVLEHQPGPAWFPWADYRPDGTLVVAWDPDITAAPADTFGHVLKIGATPAMPLGPLEQLDIDAVFWAGSVVPEPAWPRVCGPAGYSDPPVADATGKDCSVFHGDYTGLAVGADGSINVVWTGSWMTDGGDPQAPQVRQQRGGGHRVSPVCATSGLWGRRRLRHQIVGRTTIRDPPHRTRRGWAAEEHSSDSEAWCAQVADRLGNAN